MTNNEIDFKVDIVLPFLFGVSAGIPIALITIHILLSPGVF